MKRSEGRFLTTHSGSLIRPRSIRHALLAQQLGRDYDVTEFQADLRASVAEVVRHELDVGLDVPSDGEFGKSHWNGYIRQRLSGIDMSRKEPSTGFRPATKDFADYEDFYRAFDPIVRYDWEPPAPGESLPSIKDLGQVRTEFTGPVSYIGQEAIARDIENFKVALAGSEETEAFMPSASPLAVVSGRSNPAYGSDEEFLFAVAESMSEEYKAITDAGFILQIDDAVLPQIFDRMRGHDEKEIRSYCEVGIDALNSALATIPEDRVRLHVCWGSWNGPHTSDTPLQRFIDLIFKVKAQGYGIEASNARHEHEWKVWEETRLPDGKVLIPGCISHQTNVIEHPELVELRIATFAKLVGRENVIAGSDCGFCQGYNEVRVHPSIQWGKLQSLVQGAERASHSLF